MPKIRVYQLAKELNITTEKLTELLAKKNIEVKNQFQALDEEVVSYLRKHARKDKEKKSSKTTFSKHKQKTKTSAATTTQVKTQPKTVAPAKPAVVKAETQIQEKQLPIVEIPEGATVKEFAEAIGKHPNEIIKMLLKLGEMLTVNQPISLEAVTILAEELGVEAKVVSSDYEVEEEVSDETALLKTKPPVVTVMGHVDHGKTSLLDAIRQTNIISEEAGGITQHIGAYQVEHQGKKITFIDTPGHEAFTAMRARGASVTDIAVLVVAADDGVMPQTVEAIDHARAANVPIIVAINKIDKPDANPEKVKQELTEHQLIPEEWGGDTVFVEVSAKQKINLNELLDMILLLAEMRELKANPQAKARGVVIEAKLDKGRGPVATLLVERGTLKVGDGLVTGTVYGKLRALVDSQGKRIKAAYPGDPVEVIGLSAVPQAGDSFKVVADEKTARQIAEERALKKRLAEHRKAHVTLANLFDRLKEGQTQELKLIIKADAQGSIEAARDALEKLSDEEVQIKIVHKGVGGITETDVMLAAASDAIVVGFNVRPDTKAKELAEKEKVDIRTYRVIYKLVEDINAARQGLLAPKYEEIDVGKAQVRQTFKVPKSGLVAGSYVLEGEVKRESLARLVRDGVVIYEGKIASLRRFKEDAKVVKAGYECGIGLENFQDIKEGDLIEAYELKEVKPT